MDRVKQPLLIRALHRAMAYCHMMMEAEENSNPPGSPPSRQSVAYRREAERYRRLLAKLQPERRGAVRA